MKHLTLLILFFCSCSSFSEPTSQQHQAWFNTCGVVEYLQHEVTDGQCGDWVLWGCKDGDRQVMYQDAPAKLWIGDMCFQDEQHVFRYECGVVDGHAQVFCKDW